MQPTSGPMALAADDALDVLTKASSQLKTAGTRQEVEQVLAECLKPSLTLAVRLDPPESQAKPEPSAVAFPLVSRGRLQGTLWVVPNAAGLSVVERNLYALLADQTAAALDLLAAGEADAAMEHAVEERTVQFFRASTELASRNRALEAFAGLSRELVTETDVLQLVRRAQETMLTLLPEGASVYLEQGDDGWQSRSLVGEVDERLGTLLRAGLSVPPGGPLERIVQAGQPLFEGQGWSRTGTRWEVPLEQIGALAILPLSLRDRPGGAVVVGLLRQRHWRDGDRALLATAIRQLQVAVERTEAQRAVAEQQRLLSERSEQLAELNRELEAFSYSVSHDLRAPLRHINGFADLARRRGASLDPTSLRYLDTIVDASSRMGDMIDALLEHARLGRQALRRVPVDLNRVVQEVRAELGTEIAERPIVWEVGRLPEVPGDPLMLRLMLQNLLANAVKYTRGRRPAIVRVTGHLEGDELLLEVRDNGTGFDQAQADRLFKAFQRLHRAEEFEGSGIGLANVRSIAARHSGRVWAQGIPGEGAAFFVALPLN